jgi:polysaccharide chain length determinant protein (PEP-CTERM system associated)
MDDSLNIRQLVDQALDYLRGAWRFRWLAFAVAALVCLSGWFVVLRMTDYYQAGAGVFVDTQTMLREVTRGLTLEPNVDTQISRVRQMMLSGPNLWKVARDVGVINDDTPPAQAERLVDSLAQRLVVDGGGTGGSGSAYFISFQDPDPQVALHVVEDLLNTFVEDTLGGKISSSEKAQEFLMAQIAEYERRLSEAEARLADFKKEYVGLMPGSQGDFFNRLQDALTAMQEVEAQLNLALQERATLQRQLDSQTPYLSPDEMARAAVAESLNSRKLDEARVRLAELLVDFKDAHPEVVAVRETIRDLEQRQVEELEAARRGNLGAAGNAGLAANPVYRQIQLDFNQNEVRVSSLQAELANKRKEVAQLRAQVDIAPTVEAKYAQLNRDYSITKDQYQALLQRLDRTQLGEVAEEEGAVQFEVINPPSVSAEPVAPDRLPMIAGILVLAIGAGAGGAFLLHLLNPVYSTPSLLEAAIGVPVIGVVPLTWLDKHRAAFRRNIVHYASAVAVLVLLAVVVMTQEGPLVRLLQGGFL